jgi:DNA-binding transcriptional ArsR family regulator
MIVGNARSADRISLGFAADEIIDYDRSSMVIDDQTAKLYAGWFACLADASRLRILNLLAASAAPLSIGEIVSALAVGQPTVSHHVRQLQQARFVQCERRGARTLVRVNKRCLRAFPSAAAVVMGTLPATEQPWARRAA